MYNCHQFRMFEVSKCTTDQFRRFEQRHFLKIKSFYKFWVSLFCPPHLAPLGLCQRSRSPRQTQGATKFSSAPTLDHKSAEAFGLRACRSRAELTINKPILPLFQDYQVTVAMASVQGTKGRRFKLPRVRKRCFPKHVTVPLMLLPL